MLPPMIVLNMDRSKDRCSRVVSHLIGCGMPFKIFSAFDGKALGLKSENPYLRDHNDWAPPYGDGERPAFFAGAGIHGLMITYLAVVKMALFMGWEELIILEDDVVLCEGFKEKFAQFHSELPEDWLYAHLGSAERYCNNMLQISPSVAIGFACCTEAMLYRRSALELINARAKLYAPYDVFLLDDIAAGRRMPIAHPFKLARQLSADGEIETTLS